MKDTLTSPVSSLSSLQVLHLKIRLQDRTLAGGDPALEEEQNLKKRVTKLAWGIAKDKAAIHLSMQKVQEYEEKFAKIQKV